MTVVETCLGSAQLLLGEGLLGSLLPLCRIGLLWWGTSVSVGLSGVTVGITWFGLAWWYCIVFGGVVLMAAIVCCNWLVTSHTADMAFTTLLSDVSLERL